jgi:DNA-binding MarR family transcriptional regulator
MKRIRQMDIKKLHDVLDLLKQEVGNVTLLQLQILLNIIIAETVTQQELIEKYRTTAATISRNTNMFRDREVRNNDGKWVQINGFMTFADDPDDARKLILSLNSRGQELKKRINNFR